MNTSIRQLGRNIAAGNRLARFRNIDPRDFHVSVEQLVVLVAFNIALSWCTDWLGSLPYPAYNSTGVAMSGFSCLMLLCASTLAALWQNRDIPPLAVCIMVFSSLPSVTITIQVLLLLSARVPEQPYVLHSLVLLITLLLVFAVICRPAMLGSERPRQYPLRVPAVYLLAWLLPVGLFAPNSASWYAGQDPAMAVDEFDAYRRLDIEDVYTRQPALLATGLARLAPQRAGIDELYFVGFAGFARQDVFLNEIRYARDLFDRRFDTAGRSLLLANNLSTLGQLPLASRSNLQRVLASIGDRLDRDNDILVLFLTSHGSQEQLSVDFWPLGLNDLTPEQLRADLDSAGIRWRVIIISACHSGTFINALREPHTLVLTAAASDRTSFGCGDGNEMTYFGEALLKHQLSTSHSFEAAFSAAAGEIAKREQAEGLSPSRPQIYIGDAIKDKLATLSDILDARLAADRSPRALPLLSDNQ